MDVSDAQYLDLSDASHSGEARRRVALLAAETGLDQKAIDRVAVVCAELTSNVVKHGKGGFLLAQGLIDGDDVGIDIFAMDRGKGMVNVPNCLEDGFSTTGTLGTGLGAIQRMSDTMDIATTGRGTAVHSRVWQAKQSKRSDGISGITVPIKGELLSGDKWQVCDIENGLYCIVVDGLGHGFEAAEASKLAVKRFRENLSQNPANMIKTLHQALRGTRGAVSTVAKIDFAAQEMVYAGLGNIGGVLVTNSEHKHLTSLNGTLGYESRKITEFRLPWSSKSTLIMHSDGLSSKVSEELAAIDCPNMTAAIIAASLYLHQAKRSDDATILVVKQAG